MSDTFQAVDLQFGGPGAPPQPWKVSGNTISYDGCILSPSTVQGGNTGPGSINTNALYVNGVEVVNPVGNFLPLSGGTMTGILNILNLSYFTLGGGAPGQILATNGSSNLNWTSDLPGGPYLPLTGGTLSGLLQMISPLYLSIGGGSLGNVLSTDGSGNLSWINLSGNLPPPGTAGDVLVTQPTGSIWSSVLPGGPYAVEVAGGYLPLSGGHLTGSLTLAADPVNPLDASTKQYSDLKLPLAGGTLTGALILAGDPTTALGAATMRYVQNGFLPLVGGNLTGALSISSSSNTPLYINSAQAAGSAQFSMTLANIRTFAIRVLSSGSLDIADVSASGSPQRFIINTAGAITIPGTLSSGQHTVNGTINVTSSAIISGNVQSAGGVYPAYPSMTDFFMGPTGSNRYIQWAGGWYMLWNATNGNLQWVGGGGSTYQTMLLDGSGNLTVRLNISGGGTISAASTITTPGTVQGANIQATGGLGYYDAHTGYWFSIGWNGSVPLIYINNGGGQNLIMSWGAANQYAVYNLLLNTNSYCYAGYSTGAQAVWAITYSDPRLKTNIETSGDAVAALNLINVIEADITAPFPEAEPRHWKWSVIAEPALNDIVPNAYVEPPNELSYATINTYPIVAALVKAVQQLTARIETLESRTLH